MDFVFKTLIGFDVLWLCICFVTEANTAVKREPMFDSPEANVTVKEMSLAVLPCSVKYLGRRQVIWTDKFSTVLTHEDRRVIDDNRLSLERPFIKDWNLHIRNVRYKDRGMYNCLINTDPVKIKVVYLTVQVPAKILNDSTPTSVKIHEGKTVRLQCNVSGIPTPNVTWYRLSQDEKGEHKKSESCTPTRKIGMSGEVLVIHNISRHCADNYQCVADNGVPPAVTRNISVSVHFQPEVKLPNSRMGQIIGKETILECQVTASPLGGAVWVKNGEEMTSLSGKYRVEMFRDDSMSVTLSLKISFLEKKDYGDYTCRGYNSIGQDSGTMELYEYELPKKPSSTTSTTTVATLHGVPPYKTRTSHSHRQNKPDHIPQHHHQRHNNNNNNNNSKQRYHHGSGSVVVNDNRGFSIIPDHKPKGGRFHSGNNEGNTGKSRGMEGRGSSSMTSSWMMSVSLALVTVLFTII